MKFAECNCPTCGIYLVTFENNIPKQKHLFCPICNYANCSVTWIDKDEEN